MHADIAIKTAQLGLLAEALRTAASAITDEIVELETSSQTMLDGWEGEAADAYVERKREVTANLTAERAQLTSCAQLAEGIKSLYAKADVELARILGDQ